MTKRRWTALLLALAVVGLVGFKSSQDFRPPRLAVIDISEVFESYDKKAHRQEALAAEARKVEVKFKGFEERLQELNETIQLLQPGDKRNDRLLEKAKLEIELKEIGTKEGRSLRDKQMTFLRELREEIAREIEVYAEAYDLDVVFEKSVTADPGRQATPGFSWPIVHYAKPELDITQQVVQRLNDRYRKSR